VHKFAKANGIPVRYFTRGERKEEIARPFIEAAAAAGSSGGADRDRAGEGVGVAVLAGPRPAGLGAPAHGVGPADGLHQPFLFLLVGRGVGWRVLEDQRLCALAGVDLAERA
jgi:hypothetical protein